MDLLTTVFYLVMIILTIAVIADIYSLKNRYGYKFLHYYLVYIATFYAYTLVTLSMKIWAFQFFAENDFIIVAFMITLVIPVLLAALCYLFLFFQKTLNRTPSRSQLIFIILYQFIIFSSMALSVFEAAMIIVAGALYVSFITAIVIYFFITSLKTDDQIIKKFTLPLSALFLVIFPITLIFLEFSHSIFTLFQKPSMGYILIALILFSINIPPLLYLHITLKKNHAILDTVYSDGLHSPLDLSFLKLTSREQEIAELVVLGKTNNEIGDILYISEKTVKNNISSIYRKTGVKNRVQLTRIAQKGN